MSASSSPHDDLSGDAAEARPVVQALNAVGTPWRLQILYALRSSELRFNEIKRVTGGRSKTVSDALDVLNEHALIARRTEEAAPIAVYYSVTQKGETLLGQLDEISQWAVEWMDEVEDPAALTNRLR